MAKIRLYDKRSGLSMDYNVDHVVPTVVVQQFDAKYRYERIYWIEDQLSNGTYLFKYQRSKRTRKGRGCW